MANCISLNLKKILLACSIVTLASCGGSNSGSAPQSLEGAVLAPGGTVAIKKPTFIDSFYAAVMGKQAQAALDGVIPAASAVVELIEVDDTGTQVGAVIAEGTSAADGTFSIDLPNGFELTANMVVRADGLMNSRVDDISDVTVDPISNAASQFIVDNAIALDALTVGEVAVINDAVEDIAQQIEGLSGTVADYTSALVAQAANDEETSAIVANTAAAGSICGTVTDNTSAPLENIRIIVKTFSDPLTVGKSKTAADGTYCVNLPDGQYIIGAFNFTNTSFAASEWFTAASPSGAGGVSQFDADPVTVAGTTASTANFQLQPGSRIEGSVLANVDNGSFTAGTPLEGVKVQIRDYDSFIPLVSPRVKSDGSYRVNVPSGKYLLYARNKTRFPYASQFFDNANGSPTRNLAQPVTVNGSGDTSINNFDLKAGFKISGTVTDSPTAGAAVPGMRVRVDMSSTPGGAAARLRTNKLGKYRVWLEGGFDYRVQSRGQSDTSVVALSSNQTVNFDAEMIKVTANLSLASTPVREAKVFIQDGVSVFSQELSNATGDVEMFVPTSGCADCKLRVIFDGGQFIASEHYQNIDVAALYDSVVITAGAKNSTQDVGAWPLRTGGLLMGTAFTNGTLSTTEGNIRVRARKEIGGDFAVNTNTRADGTYMMSLPPGTYDRIRVEHVGGVVDYDSTISITAGAITTLNSNP